MQDNPPKACRIDFRDIKMEAYTHKKRIHSSHFHYPETRNNQTVLC